MTKKRKPGRPKLPKDQAKGKIIPVRFTEEESRELEQAARENGQTVSEWIRGKVRAIEASKGVRQ